MMPTVLGLGDNTIDIYVDRGMQYPGGNALNFAVYAKMLGAASHYLGCIGEDAYGDQIEEALKAEGVYAGRMRRTAKETSWSRVRHTDGDRWFDGSHLYSADEYDISLDDQAYMDQFDLVHTSVNSILDDRIDEIVSVSRRLSYDFSDKYTDSSLSRIAPHLEVAVLSQAGGDAKAAEALANKVAALGVRHVLVTRGSAGAMCFVGGKLFEQGIIPTKAVDTLGAGDAFSAAYIVEMLKETETQQCLRIAAHFASKICQVEAAFGHGQPAKSIPPSNQSQEEAQAI